ncbi:MAG TPA: acetyl-CoA carboxylase carboxyl transferase subunit alpha, partial [Sphingomonas sp.]|nr:acetyl-CoA carboxylase carboxyl transferase subunit alpha [Sphingomonas sp.]
GALAIGVADQVLMLQYSVYSVISPEGCASILWRTADKAAEAAEAMKVTAQHLKELGVIDRIVPEPLGGAHRDPAAAIAALGDAIAESLKSMDGMSAEKLRQMRRGKFLAMGRI